MTEFGYLYVLYDRMLVGQHLIRGLGSWGKDGEMGVDVLTEVR